LYLVVTYGLFALCTIAIIGLIRDARRARRLSAVSSSTVAIPPGITDGADSTAGTPTQRSQATYESLERVHRLHADGALTDEEFESEKRKLLN
jgi:hypothetical protein